MELLFRHWCKAPYWQMAEHVTAINISLLLTGGCILLGSNLSDAWSYGLAFVPALIPYTIGFTYIYFFARRNETVYLLEMWKMKRYNEVSNISIILLIFFVGMYFGFVATYYVVIYYKRN